MQGVPCESEEAVEGCFCPPDTVEVEGECVDATTCTNCVDIDGTIYSVSAGFSISSGSWSNTVAKHRLLVCVPLKNLGLQCSNKMMIGRTVISEKK